MPVATVPAVVTRSGLTAAAPATLPVVNAETQSLVCYLDEQRDSVLEIVDGLPEAALGRAVFAPLFDMAAATPNIARFIFLDPAAQSFYRDWESLAGDTVALLRAEAGRDP